MKNWIAVASANHVAIGRVQGFMQVNHGKEAPLRRIAPGDLVAYYSPVEVYGSRMPLQAFTALGRVREGAPYMGHMGQGFTPFRRDVDWFTASPAPIRPLFQILEFTKDTVNWGGPFRYGLFSVSQADLAVIARAMDCSVVQGATS